MRAIISHIHMKMAQELSLVSNIIELEGLLIICKVFIKMTPSMQKSTKLKLSSFVMKIRFLSAGQYSF